MNTIALVSPEISCEHCQRAIEEAIGALPGVKTVTVEVEAKTVTVEFDPSVVTSAAIRENLAEEGYPAQS